MARQQLSTSHKSAQRNGHLDYHRSLDLNLSVDLRPACQNEHTIIRSDCECNGLVRTRVDHPHSHTYEP